MAENYGLNKVIADDETGFAGDDRVKPYRREAWDFLLAGGAVFSNLDYSFTVGHEEGTPRSAPPAAAGRNCAEQLQILKEFLQGFDFLRMKPDDAWSRATCRKVSRPACSASPAKPTPSTSMAAVWSSWPSICRRGRYKAEWMNTKTGSIRKGRTSQSPRPLAHLFGPQIYR